MQSAEVHNGSSALSDPNRVWPAVFSPKQDHPTGSWECLAAISLYLYLSTAWLVVPDLKANQTDESQPSEDEPAQGSDHYDEK
jgi:hypothetical protein